MHRFGVELVCSFAVRAYRRHDLDQRALGSRSGECVPHLPHYGSEIDMDKTSHNASNSPLNLKDLDGLAGLRDELRLQAHLFNAELKDRWQDAEARWVQIQQEARAIKSAVGHTRAELGAAVSLAVESLQETYEDLKQAVRVH